MIGSAERDLDGLKFVGWTRLLMSNTGTRDEAAQASADQCGLV